jgi:MFS family permease
MSQQPETRATATPMPTWFPALMLVLVQVANGAWYMPQLNFFPVYLQVNLGLGSLAVSAIVAGGLLGGMLFALLGGAVAARVTSKWTLVAGLLLAAAGTCAFLVRNPVLVAVLWFVGGAGLALITVGGGSYLTRVSARGSLGILAAFYVVSMTVGGVFGNLLSGVVVDTRGFAVFGLVEIAIIGATMLFASLLLPQLETRSREDGSGRLPIAGALPLLRLPTMRWLVGLRGLPTIFYGMLTVLVPLLLRSQSGSTMLVAFYGTTQLVVASLAQLVAGRSADRWGAARPTAVAYSFLILGGVGLAIFSQQPAGLFAFGVVAVASAWALSTLMFVWVSDGLPKSEHPAALGLLHAVWSLSMITGSLVGGWLARLGPGLPFLLGAALNAACPMLVLAYYRRLAVSGPERRTEGAAPM